ncbi:hypothetical protein K432DRAFT_410468 [Lepidopterella palustris CBS 459.81]|uniref:Uncharacterized protein n=1 Tax=Lepidopterella palustris CBS 459.81 TaxID=1314670 RepID=A0A8E2DY51_9PEZI|nr:hypothetical protein K432DRAFT_410468 [Lepidopterella palustris CBS 459.81]
MLLIAALLIAGNFMRTTTDISLAWQRPDLCLYCLFNNSSLRKKASVGVDIFSMIWLFSAYANRLVALYDSDVTTHSRSWIYRCFMRKGSRQRSDPYTRQNILDKIHAVCESHRAPRSKAFINAAHLLSLAYVEMKGSFWWEIVWLLFGAAYGLTTVFTVWFSRSQSGQLFLGATATTMGFGQIVPLLLLILPIFAALEAKADATEVSQASNLPNSTQPNESIAQDAAETISAPTTSIAQMLQVPDPTRQSHPFANMHRLLEDHGNDPYKVPIYKKTLHVTVLIYTVYVPTCGFFLAIIDFIAWIFIVMILFFPEALILAAEIIEIYKAMKEDRAQKRRRQHPVV